MPVAEIEMLRDKLREAQETLEAIRSGEVDAVVVAGANGNQVYSLTGAEQPYRIYVERMQEGAVTLAPDGVVLYCNRRFAEMLGSPLERVIGSAVEGWMAQNTWLALRTVLTGATETAKQDGVLLRADANPLPVNFTASRLPLDARELICLVVTDLTLQKQQEQLRLEKEIVEKASLAKDAFLATLSHELRTPLNPALIAAVELEGDPTLPAAARQEIAMIRRNVELEARLIDDLLDLTRVAQGKLQLHTVALEFHSLVWRALQICRPELEAKQQCIDVELSATATGVQGDPVRLKQVVWNLLRNAGKFTPPGGTVRVRSGNREGCRFWLSVQDTGIGFTAEQAPRIFRPFEQASSEITRQFGGLGLGLAISRSIVEGHGGTIRAESDGVDRGATFTIELPLRGGTLVDTEAPHETAAAATGGGLRILLVEDHGDTRRSMARLLQRARHRVWAVGTAHEALELARRERVDVVVTDLGLPDLSGIELMKRLRAEHELTGIATSGYGMGEDLAQTRAAGFRHHLVKPIRMEELHGILAEIAKTSQHRGETAVAPA